MTSTSLSVQEIMNKLAEPFREEDIEWRVQRYISKQNKVAVCPYINARAVMNRLDAVLGIGNWKDEYVDWKDNGVKCILSVRIGEEWISKEDVGEETNRHPLKGGFSDALKRAAVKWGIGRYIYEIEEVLVPLTKDKAYENDQFFYDRQHKVSGYWTIPDLKDEHRLDEEKGRQGVLRGRRVAGRSQGGGQPVKEAPAKITADTQKSIATLLNEVTKRSGGRFNLAEMLQRQFGKKSVAELTEHEGTMFLSTLTRALAGPPPQNKTA